MQEYLLAGQLDMGHARALLGLAAGQQTGAAARVVAQGLSVRETERLVHHAAAPGEAQARPRAPRAADPDLARLQEELAEIARRQGGDRAAKRDGAGRVVIGYSSLEQLDGILQRFRR